MSSLCIEKIGDSLVSQTRLLVVPATKEILTIIMGEVDQEDFKFRKSDKERSPSEIDKEAELIDEKIIEEYHKTKDLKRKLPNFSSNLKVPNYRDILNQRRGRKISRKELTSESCNARSSKRSRPTSRVTSINQSRSSSRAIHKDFNEQMTQTPDAHRNPTSPSNSTQRCQNTTTRNDGASVFVGNLNYSTSEQKLGEAFDIYGVVNKVKIIVDRGSGRSKGYGFVEFADAICAAEAIKKMDGGCLDGRTLKVKKAYPRN